MTSPVYLVEITAAAWPRFLRSGWANWAGSWYNGRNRIAVDPAKTYRVKARARRATTESGPSTGRFYMGVALFNATGDNITGDGGQWFYAANAVTPGTGWTSYSGDFGAGTGRPFPGGATSMAPLVILNYDNSAGAMDVRELSIADLAAPTVPISTDPTMRTHDEWVLFVGSVGSFRALVGVEAETLTLRYGTAGYQTSPTDTPPNTHYAARVLQPALLRFELPPDGAGALSMGFGEILLANGDGALGELAYHGLDGQIAKVKVGMSDQPLSSFATLLTATMEQAVVDRKVARIRLVAPDAILDRPLLTTRYAGNNALPAGLEGGPELKGRPKPILYGRARAIEAPCVNTTRNIYQVTNHSLGANTTDVLIGSVQLTKGADYTTQADMEANAPGAGTFRVWPAGGYFRLAAAPTSVVTAYAWTTTGDGTREGYFWTVLRQIALDAGVPPADFAFPFTYTPPAPDNWAGTWSSSEPWLGIWVDDLRTARAALTEIAASIGGWAGFSYWDGLLTPSLRFGAEIYPPPASALTVANRSEWVFDESAILDVRAITDPGPDRGVPTWRVDLTYAQNNRVLSNADIPGANPQSLGALGAPHQIVIVEDAGVKTKHATARTLIRDTTIPDAATWAGYEAQRQLELHRHPRLWFEVRLALAAVAHPVRTWRPRLGGYVYLKWPELTYITADGAVAAEGWFSVQAAEIDIARSEVRLTVRQATEQTI